jgi:hypothetical protein
MEEKLREHITEFLTEKSTGKNARRRFKHRDVVPRAYIESLQTDDFGQCDINWPERQITLKELVTRLDGTYKFIAVRKYPELFRSFLPEASYSTKRI